MSWKSENTHFRSLAYRSVIPSQAAQHPQQPKYFNSAVALITSQAEHGYNHNMSVLLRSVVTEIGISDIRKNIFSSRASRICDPLAFAKASLIQVGSLSSHPN